MSLKESSAHLASIILWWSDQEVPSLVDDAVCYTVAMTTKRLQDTPGRCLPYLEKKILVSCERNVEHKAKPTLIKTNKNLNKQLIHWMTCRNNLAVWSLMQNGHRNEWLKYVTTFASLDEQESTLPPSSKNWQYVMSWPLWGCNWRKAVGRLKEERLLGERERGTYITSNFTYSHTTNPASWYCDHS